jgi:hypothetical protein
MAIEKGHRGLSKADLVPVLDDLSCLGDPALARALQLLAGE